MHSRQSLGTFVRLSIAAGLWLCLSSRGVLAQPYKEVPRAITDPRQVGQLRREVNAIVRTAGSLSADDRRKLQDYYVMHIMAGMTQNEPFDDPAQLPNWRKTIVGDLNTMDGAPQKYAFVRDLVFRVATRMVEDRQYSPAARYNALLIIGELNEREAQGGRNVIPAVPYARARQQLLNVLKSDDTQEMKVAALLGLGRHARLVAASGRPDADLVRAFVSVFVTVLQQQEPKNGESADGLMWMHRIAIDALGDIGQPGAAKILAPILSDTSAPKMLRCSAAEALGRLDYRNAGDLNQGQLLKGLGQLAADALANQLQMLQDYIRENPVDPALEGRLRAPDEEPPTNPMVKRVRRQLKYELYCVWIALRALQQAPGDAATKNAATALYSEIDALVKELNDEKLSPQELFDKIARPAVGVENAIRNL